MSYYEVFIRVFQCSRRCERGRLNCILLKTIAHLE